MIVFNTSKIAWVNLISKLKFSLFMIKKDKLVENLVKYLIRHVSASAGNIFTNEGVIVSQNSKGLEILVRYDYDKSRDAIIERNKDPDIIALGVIKDFVNLNYPFHKPEVIIGRGSWSMETGHSERVFSVVYNGK